MFLGYFQTKEASSFLLYQTLNFAHCFQLLTELYVFVEGMMSGAAPSCHILTIIYVFEEW